MRVPLIFLLLFVTHSCYSVKEEDDDDDFAEFDLANEDEIVSSSKQEADVTNRGGGGDDDDEEEEEEGEEEATVVVEDDGEEKTVTEDNNADDDNADDEFSHFEDTEEFEGYRQDEDEAEDPEDDDEEFENKKKGKRKTSSSSSTKTSTKEAPPKTINITKIPAHLHTNWENYYLEILMICGIAVYFVNFFTGKSKNQKIAQAWFSANKSMLESNFALVGDDGAKDVDDIKTQLQKESESVFTLWCSGCVCCEGMLVELKLLKRQDLVSVVSALMKPAYDQLQIRVNMTEMDSFVFAVASKRSAARMTKELNDINTFCPERRSPQKDVLPPQYQIMSEFPEVSAAMLYEKSVALLPSMMWKYPDVVESIHFSDQFTGPKPTDEQTVMTLPEGRKVLIFTFNVVLKNKTLEEAMEKTKPLMSMVFYYINKVKKFRLSKEAKNKSAKNRSKVAELFWKSIHAAKAEKAQEERERKRRELKERIREIEDPDKQRKLEDRENRRDRKKAAPKMKQLKVKAM